MERILRGYLKSTWVRQAIAVLGIGVIVALIGPFGTFRELTLPVRLLYWLVLVAAAWMQWILLDRAVLWLAVRLLGAWPGPWWGREILLCILAPVPLLFEIVGLRGLFGLPSGPSWLELYAWVAGITALTCAFTIGVVHWARAAFAEDQSAAGTEPCPAPEFLDRMPAEKRGRLLCLKTEDHYLRVFTDRGEDLILLRLKDALRELEGQDGRQVHRSYWVSRDAVAESRRERRKTCLILTNGLEVPVSETYLPDLRAAGWLG